MQKKFEVVFTTQLIGLVDVRKPTRAKQRMDKGFSKTCLLLYVGVILWANLDFAL
jgi:hypothetical protein